jgi:hypothetical protein
MPEEATGVQHTMPALPAAPQPWEKLPHETSHSFGKFQKFLKLGPDRSLEKLRRSYGRASVTLRAVEMLSSKYSWVERAAAYDAECGRRTLEAVASVGTETALVAARDRVRARLEGLDETTRRFKEIVDFEIDVLARSRRSKPLETDPDALKSGEVGLMMARLSSVQKTVTELDALTENIEELLPMVGAGGAP